MPVWIVVRCTNKTLRHCYNAYLACNLKFKYYWVDWIRMSSFYLLYTAEYALTLALAFTAIPALKTKSQSAMPNTLNFSVDLTLLLYGLICLSVPNFVSTWVYLH